MSLLVINFLYLFVGSWFYCMVSFTLRIEAVILNKSDIKETNFCREPEKRNLSACTVAPPGVGALVSV